VVALRLQALPLCHNPPEKVKQVRPMQAAEEGQIWPAEKQGQCSA